MVTAPEAAALLAVASGYDNRKVSRETTSAWAESLEPFSFQDVRNAIIEHYQSSKEWLMVADIIKAVRRVEDERIGNGPDVDMLEIPERLAAMEDGPEFTTAYLEWLQETKRRIRHGLPIEHGPEAVLTRKFDPDRILTA